MTSFISVDEKPLLRETLYSDSTDISSFALHSKSNTRKKAFLTFLALAGLAVAFTTAFVSFFSRTEDDPFRPRMILKEQSCTVPARNPAYLVEAYNGVVATENKRCSDLGLQKLRKGGSAVDAAIAATLCIGVVNSFSSGIGGGGYMTVRVPPDRKGLPSKVYTIDFRGTAPAATTPEMFNDGKRNLSESGGLSVVIPGELRGLQEAHNHWGALPWKDLVVPNAELALGWTVDKELGKRIPWFGNLFLNNPDWSAVFAPQGTLLKEGDPIERNNLAATLLNVAHNGTDVFYNGSIARALVKKIRATGGHATLDDFQNYKVNVFRSLEGTYHGKKLYTARAPSSGPVLLHMLNLVEKYNFTRRSALDTHRMVEAIKFGFAERTRISDPRFRFDTTLIDEIPTMQFADEIRERINDARTQPAEYYRPLYTLQPDSGTSHISVMDKDGMMVAITSSVNWYWGSQVLDDVTGVILNNHMNDFSTFNTTNLFGEWPARWNLPYPGKRPLSSMCPTIVENADGSPYIAIGASGGPTIFPAVFQTLINIINYDLDPSEAIEFGRLHNQLKPEVTIADESYRADILEALRRKRHVIEVKDIYRNGSSCVQAVMKVPNSTLLLAASDSRKNGIAAGY